MIDSWWVVSGMKLCITQEGVSVGNFGGRETLSGRNEVAAASRVT